jgi:hypothetical protein
MADEAGKRHKIERKVAKDRKKKAARHEGDAPRREGCFHAPPLREAPPHQAGPSRIPAANRIPPEPRGTAKPVQRASGAHAKPQRHLISSSGAARRVPIRTRARNSTKRTVFVANVRYLHACRITLKLIALQLVPDSSLEVVRKVKRLFADCGAVTRTSISVCPGTPMFHNALTGPQRVGAYQGAIEFLDDQSVSLALGKHLSVFEGRRIVVCRTPAELSEYHERIVQANSASKRYRRAPFT